MSCNYNANKLESLCKQPCLHFSKWQSGSDLTYFRVCGVAVAKCGTGHAAVKWVDAKELDSWVCCSCHLQDTQMSYLRRPPATTKHNSFTLFSLSVS